MSIWNEGVRTLDEWSTEKVLLSLCNADGDAALVWLVRGGEEEAEEEEEEEKEEEGRCSNVNAIITGLIERWMLKQSFLEWLG